MSPALEKAVRMSRSDAARMATDELVDLETMCGDEYEANLERIELADAQGDDAKADHLRMVNDGLGDLGSVLGVELARRNVVRAAA